MYAPTKITQVNIIDWLKIEIIHVLIIGYYLKLYLIIYIEKLLKILKHHMNMLHISIVLQNY